MATTNRDRVGTMLELLQSGLTPFVQREMEAAYKSQWLTQASHNLRDLDKDDPHFDAHALLVLMWEQWNEVFRNTLGHAERSLVSELRTVRNDWAHQKPISGDDAYRALDSAARLLTAISAPEAREVERQKQELLRIRFEEQARRERRKAAVSPLEGQPSGGLRPWRELVTPHPDVASGRYQQAEFAADLDAVHHNDATTGNEYRDPVEFFKRTYLTDGLHKLLRNALTRLGGGGGDPVVELKTNFGGGKTHSMLALYHLFSGIDATKLVGMEALLDEQSINAIPKARRVVLVGTALSPGQPHTKADGTVVRTLWGELAWQLGAPDQSAAAYALVAESDAKGTSPGSQVLAQLFNRFGPALILIDEWVAFMRQLYKKDDLPAGSFDANLTFAQALTEAVKQAPTTLLVASLPASQIEIGGEGGHEALTRLQNTFGRIEATWRPASAEESFEIVRRRLFQPITEPRDFAARDAVISNFGRMYRDQSAEFPNATHEARYERRMTAAYPIHPELFDRLYNDWSTLERFQRTRGVLRLMASVIHALWERNDSSLLIQPASIPIDDPDVQKELTRYLEDNWVPVIETDVDGPASLPLALDRDNPNLGRYSASRRVARAIYMGSAPTVRTNNPGLDERSIKLSCVQPGESAAIFGDALRRLTDNATHLYVDRSRYWYSTQPSVTRTALDRAAQLDALDVWEELKRRLRADKVRGDFAAVHPAPGSSADVPDEMSARLVILGPEYPHVRKGIISYAQQQARQILQSRGNSPRLYQNMLVFLAPDHTRLQELEAALRTYMAWKSIHGDEDKLNLDAFQRNQAKTKLEDSDKMVNARIKETYIWLLSPFQSDPRNPDTLTLEEVRLQIQDGLAVQSAHKLINEEWLFTQFAGLRLRMELEKHNLWQQADHITLKQLWEYFARYPYLPRLRNQDVLLGAVQDGISQITWQEYFAYAGRYDADRQRYQGLKVGERGAVYLDTEAVLVKPDIAFRQIEQDRQAEAARQIAQNGETYVTTGDSTTGQNGTASGSSSNNNTTTTKPTPIPPAVVNTQRRFYGSVELDTLHLASDASKIAEAIIQHLCSLPGAKVKVNLDIEADLPGGANDHLMRTITENAHTLKFKSAEFDD